MRTTKEFSEKREIQILSSLDKHDYMSRGQIQQLHNLKSDRNACKVLSQMGPYLNSFRDGQNIFYLNKRGAQHIDAKGDARQKISNVRHYLMRTDAYMHFGKPTHWAKEAPFRINGLSVIPDVTFSLSVLGNKKVYLLEIDNTQKMKVNREKIETYAKMKRTGIFQQTHGYFPQLVWLTRSIVRRDELNKWCVESQLGCKVLLWEEIK
ncbi:replication-relaxation family protein [Shouchella patagoniensis]|uniref:replication-relaxation family protein n=1 Tax=Shouchella patagoniensis TaxID=228576 RepID=UPI000995DAD0|nr:replication-relaxation family protein [Shouchella patagoniensis]